MLKSTCTAERRLRNLQAEKHRRNSHAFEHYCSRPQLESGRPQAEKHRGQGDLQNSDVLIVLEEVTPVRRLPRIDDAPGATARAAADVQVVAIAPEQTAVPARQNRLVADLKQRSALKHLQRVQLPAREVRLWLASLGRQMEGKPLPLVVARDGLGLLVVQPAPLLPQSFLGNCCITALTVISLQRLR